jgi:hypothetical protein
MTIILTDRFAQIPEWVLYHDELDALDVRVWGVLNRHGDQPFPGHKRIGQLVGKSTDTVARSLNRLAKVGAITSEARYRDDGSRTTNLYTLCGSTPLPVHNDATTYPNTPGVHPARTPGAPGTDAGAEERAIEREQYNDSETTSHSAHASVLVDVPSTFDRFWTCYPRKVAKPTAMRTWKSKVRARDVEVVLAGLAVWCEYWRARNEPEFIPHPSTWLNAESWNDQPPPVTRRAGGRQTTEDKFAYVESMIDADGNWKQ